MFICFVLKKDRTNELNTVDKHNDSKKTIAMKPSVNEKVSTVYEQLGRRSDSMDYSTLSCDKMQSVS